jgi:hypothetical protein
MRGTLRIFALILVLLALLIPMATFASGGPCPDDPELSKDCDAEPPPFYVVVNRAEEHLDDRPGTGCQPFILDHPDCDDCLTDAACAAIDVEAEVCGPMLHKRVEEGGVDPILYEMCCDCGTDPAGSWLFRVRIWESDGDCPIDPLNPDWIEGLPPGTGIELPAPLVVGGLAILGVGLVASGVLVRRRSARTA